jgi:hypothetical protein
MACVLAEDFAELDQDFRGRQAGATAANHVRTTRELLLDVAARNT